MTRNVALFGLLGGLLILFGAGVVISRKVGKRINAFPVKPTPKRDTDREAEVRRQLQGEIDRATRVLETGRELERRYPPVKAHDGAEGY